MIRIRFLLVLLLLFTGIILACKEKIFTGSVDCSACYQDKPVVETLYVYLTFNDSIDEIPLVLFRGNVEKGDTDYVDTARVEQGNPYWITVDVDKYYSVRAEYRFANKTIYAIDGTQLVPKYVSDVCDVGCYVVDKNELNLEIKKEFQE
jgi:hypothetical protein